MITLPQPWGTLIENQPSYMKPFMVIILTKPFGFPSRSTCPMKTASALYSCLGIFLYFNLKRCLLGLKQFPFIRFSHLRSPYLKSVVDALSEGLYLLPRCSISLVGNGISRKLNTLISLFCLRPHPQDYLVSSEVSLIEDDFLYSTSVELRRERFYVARKGGS